MCLKKGPFLVIKGPKIRLSNYDLDTTAPKTGGGLDINSPEIELPNKDMNRNAPKNEDINDYMKIVMLTIY